MMSLALVEEVTKKPNRQAAPGEKIPKVVEMTDTEGLKRLFRR